MMDEQTEVIRPETLALDKLIKATIARVEASPDGGASDTVLFLGNRHQSFPTAVIRDPVLEPVDKLVWMVIMLAVRETGANTAFPSYEAISRMANVSSRSTIARAIATRCISPPESVTALRSPRCRSPTISSAS